MNERMNQNTSQYQHIGGQYNNRPRVKYKKKRAKIRPEITIAVIVVVVLIVLISIPININSGLSNQKDMPKEVIISVPEDKNANAKELGKILKQNKIIKSEFWYNVYVKLLNPIKTIKPGKYKVEKGESLTSILQNIQEGNVLNEQVKLLLLEGKTVPDYAKVIAKAIQADENEVLAKLDNKENVKRWSEKYSVLDYDKMTQQGIKHPLEGYMFPDTYFITTSSSVDEIVNTILSHTQKVYAPLIKTYPKTGLLKSFYSVLTLASVVENEAGDLPLADKTIIANIFLNRLSRGMSLGSDPTTVYAFDAKSALELTKTQLNTYTPYNTRGPKMEGKLPLGPISNPGKVAIQAVINALTTDQTDDIYFVTDKNGKLYTAATLEQHNKIIDALKAKGLWIHD